MKFIIGIAIGAVGMWAYRNGKLQGLFGNAPESMQQAWQPAAERITQVAKSDQVQQAVSAVHETVAQPAPEIAKPTAAEVAGRPSEPLPTSGA